MSTTQLPAVGTILWRDLTVQNAEEVKNFYCEVVGWTADNHDMGDYNDFDIKTPEGEVITGVCHARGSNANVPPQWLMYVMVEDIDASVERCAALGGNVLDGPRMMGGYRFCVIQDPAGAVLALMGANNAA